MKCKSLTKAMIPSTVYSIGQSAFEGCTRLQEVIMDYEEHAGRPKPTPMNIHVRAFQHCIRLTLIRLPTALRVMDKTAFHNCTSLIQLDLPQAFQLKSFQNGWPLIKQVLLAAVPTYEAHQSILWKELKQVCARGKSAFRKQRVYVLAKHMRDCRRIEATSLLELALWKKSILEREMELELLVGPDRSHKMEMKIDRNELRITGGAHVVMQHVVGYLLESHGGSSSSTAITSCSIRPLYVPGF